MPKISNYLGLFFLALLLCDGNAFAHVVPVHFMIRKLCEGRPNFQSALLKMSILKPAQDNRSTDEVLWQDHVFYSAKAHWPVLNLLLESNPNSLHSAWQSFGLFAPLESDLLAHKQEQMRNMENSPRPFYKINPELSLKRFSGGIAYVSSSPESHKAIWIERESFLPISVEAPCPPETSAITWAKGSESQCRIDFERGSRLKPNSGRPFRLYLRNSKQTLLIFRIDDLKLNPTKADISESQAPTELRNLFDSIFR